MTDQDLAAHTERIRIGSGGVMLPDHAPFVVAEQFAMLEALHPGRIDLGIGRAPGTDPGTAAALRRSPDTLGAEEFPRQLLVLMAMLGDPRTDTHDRRLVPTPVATRSPQRDLARELPTMQVVGEPESVCSELAELARDTAADELMIATAAHGPSTRMRSLELLADAWRKAPATAGWSAPRPG